MLSFPLLKHVFGENPIDLLKLRWCIIIQIKLKKKGDRFHKGPQRKKRDPYLWANWSLSHAMWREGNLNFSNERKWIQYMVLRFTATETSWVQPAVMTDELTELDLIMEGAAEHLKSTDY